MQAEFVQTVEVPLLGSTQRSRGTIFTRAPDRFLMRFAEPEGDIILADGQYVWMYHPGVDPGQVMRGQLAAGGQQVDLQREFLSDANRRFEVVRTGAETIGGRETHALTLTPRQPSPYSRVRLWVDTRDNLVRRFEITELNESVRTLEVSNLQPNATIGDDVFRWSPPAGAQVYDIQ
jgi:outer membrane lipoprotein-sorting protein